MCGIAGIIRFDGIPVAEDEIRALTKHLKQRGPDAEDYWISKDQSIALGHVRLSIMDLSQDANQPMKSSNGKLIIVYNGEIYNFPEIGEQLRSKGYRFRTKSDTEVILQAYDAWGEGMLERFNGMWAFAILETESKEIILSRDRFGVKPLYYYTDSRLFIFASEIQAIHKLIPERLSINIEFLKRVCAYDNSVYGNEITYMNEIRAVMPGFTVKMTGKKVKSRQWYSLKQVYVPRRISEQAHRLKELAFDACRIRLRSDVPVATCLSGGIDSGSIVSILCEISQKENDHSSKFSHRSFTAAFPGWSSDEVADARNLALSKGMEFDAKVIECPNQDEIIKALKACDGPMPAMAFYPIWKLYQHIKSQGISVTLDGQGVDEMLGGYYLGYPALRGALQTGNIVWLRDVFKTYSGLHPDAPKWIQNDFRHLIRVSRAILDQKIKWPVKKLLEMVSLYNIKKPMFAKDLDPPIWVEKGVPDLKNSLKLALMHQFFHAPLPFLLHQYDRCSMASGVECRMPFMDYRIVEFVFSLPLRSCVGKGFTKRVLREAMKGILPEATRINRKKVGFNAPFNKWMNGHLRNWTGEMLESAASIWNSSLGEEHSLQKAIRLLNGEPVNINETVIWPVLHVAYWLKESQSYCSRKEVCLA